MKVVRLEVEEGGVYVVEMRMARVTWRNDHIQWMRHIHKHVHYTMKTSAAFQQTPKLHYTRKHVKW